MTAPSPDNLTQRQWLQYTVSSTLPHLSSLCLTRTEGGVRNVLTSPGKIYKILSKLPKLIQENYLKIRQFSTGVTLQGVDLSIRTNTFLTTVWLLLTCFPSLGTGSAPGTTHCHNTALQISSISASWFCIARKLYAVLCRKKKKIIPWARADYIPDSPCSWVII